MRDNSYDRTIERNYLQKWRFLIPEYEAVQSRAIERVSAGGRLLPPSWHLLADLPEVLQSLSAERLGGRPSAAAPGPEMARAA